MRRDRQSKTPKTQPASAGGPRKPPKKTARGLDDEPPEPVPVRIPDPVALNRLATALARAPVQIAADLAMFGVLTTNAQRLIDFDMASKIIRYYVYEPEKIG
jgi:hypothetical protein